jgi:hypothetical protein
MRAERALLRIGEYLVGLACRQLPRRGREERYREWLAELPAILHDPQNRPAAWRAVRMLGYAGDTLRGATLIRVRARRAPRRFVTVAGCVFLVVGVYDVVAFGLAVVAEPGDPLNYLRLAWGVLLVVYSISLLMRCAWRVSTLILTSQCVAGAAANLWQAERAPADWGNYFNGAFLLLAIAALWITVWIVSRRRRARQA